MNRKESDLLQFENELLNTRQHLNSLINEYAEMEQNPRGAAIWQDKICYFETELKYLNNQLQLLKNTPYRIPQAGLPRAQSTQSDPAALQEALQQFGPVASQEALQQFGPVVSQEVPRNPDPAILHDTPMQPNPAVLQKKPRQSISAPVFSPVNETSVPPVSAPAASSAHTAAVSSVHTTSVPPVSAPAASSTYTTAVPPAGAVAASPVRTQRSPLDYEKLFGKNFMGIFASVLIFISLSIFATVILPYLTDTMKLIGLYVVSSAILLAGYIPSRKNRSNKFYTALIGCGIGSLYISLLLSDLYFKVIGDLTLYILILVWAILIKYLPGLKNMVFHIIGQSGIFIATILGTALCVHDADATKFFVLTVFYFISAFVFSGKRDTNYALNICNHICKSLNLIVFAVGFALMKQSDLHVINILVVMLYMLSEFYFCYKEEYRHGLIFQLLTMANSITLIWLFHSAALFPENSTYVFMYVAAIALLIYVYKKCASYEIVSEIFFLAMIYLGCHNHPFIQEHLYAYLTAIPAMMYGKMKNRNLYLYTGLAFAAELLLLTSSTTDHYAEYLFMTAAIYLTFLFVCHTTDQICFKIAGYLLISLVVAVLVHDSAYQFMRNYNMEHIGAIEYITVKATLIPFFILALIHLTLTVLSYFGTEKPIESMMLAVNALLMVAGCAGLSCRPWKPASIMITALLFLVNSRRLLLRNQNTGYYIAFKYTVFMVCVLNSYDVTDYIISISLLLFAIVSIIIGFYRSAVAFRLYGLILSMISIVKLIMIDIHYDSTLENAFSFFISGVLCFAISFIYHKIDTNLKNNTKNQ
ncbi:MAG: DUF2339 domain-containing protein [Lachnospiraceae bacterium]|nr:DUF2339 domain-containing protein [Lachnospiraceae bacterium]